MIFITGDTHGDTDIDKLQRFAAKTNGLSKSDYVIIAGDFGAVWSYGTMDSFLDEYSSLPFTVLFVDGNHENFDILDSFPVKEWNGGKVHIIRPDVIHLMRGQVFEIEGKTFFTFGGATSTDKMFRREGTGWWRREMPSAAELDEAFVNLNRYLNRVNFIVTHSCDEKALWYPPIRLYGTYTKIYPENIMLSCFEEAVNYDHWYFGHYHLDADLTDKKTVLYQKVIRIV